MDPREQQTKCVAMQHRIRHDALAQRDVFASFAEWNKDIAAKDDEAKGDAAPAPPPVRGAARVAVRNTAQKADAGAAAHTAAAAGGAESTIRKGGKKAAPGTSLKKTAAKHTYDAGYKRWENFDAEAAADAVSDDDVPSARAESHGFCRGAAIGGGSRCRHRGRSRCRRGCRVNIPRAASGRGRAASPAPPRVPRGYSEGGRAASPRKQNGSGPGFALCFKKTPPAGQRCNILFELRLAGPRRRRRRRLAGRVRADDGARRDHRGGARAALRRTEGPRGGAARVGERALRGRRATRAEPFEGRRLRARRGGGRGPEDLVERARS